MKINFIFPYHLFLVLLIICVNVCQQQDVSCNSLCLELLHMLKWLSEICLLFTSVTLTLLVGHQEGLLAAVPKHFFEFMFAKNWLCVCYMLFYLCDIISLFYIVLICHCFMPAEM